MKLLMVSGDRMVLSGKKGAFYYTLEEFSKHWERIDVITPYAHAHASPFSNVHFHPCPKGLWYQPFWILKKGRELFSHTHHDVMTVHDYPPFYNGIGARWLHKKTGIPYASEIHHIVGWPHAASVTEWIGYWMTRLFLKWITAPAKKIRCVSNEAADLLETWGFKYADALEHGKISIIPSFYLDAELLKPDLSIEKKYDVVFCARLVANKRLKELIDAIYLLHGVSLLVIGDGPEREKCEKQVIQLGIANRVSFMGWLPAHEDVYRAMQSARIFVVNSMSEGGPRVALEAMALGLQIVTTRVGVMNQFAEYVEYTDGSPASLQLVIRKLLKDSELRSKRMEQVQFVTSMYSREVMVNSYAHFLQSLAR